MLGRDDRLARRLELVALVSAPTPEIASHIPLIPKGQRFQDAKTHFFIFNECCTDRWYCSRACKMCKTVTNNTSSGARAMRGFGTMCLLRKSRCVFLAPQCAALRCPWLSALLVPVVRVPSCARGPPCVFVSAQVLTTELYCSTVL